jgi:hypothetical protein
MILLRFFIQRPARPLPRRQELGIGRTSAQSLQIESIGALASWSSMIVSENRHPFCQIML